jgi:hypothetical protein
LGTNGGTDGERLDRVRSPGDEIGLAEATLYSCDLEMAGGPVGGPEPLGLQAERACVRGAGEWGATPAGPVLPLLVSRCLP